MFRGFGNYSELKENPCKLVSDQEWERLVKQIFRGKLVDIRPGQCDKISPQSQSSSIFLAMVGPIYNLG